MTAAPPDGTTLEDLWSRWLAGQTLDAADRNVLVAGVEQNEVFRRRVLQDWQTHNALWAAAGSEEGRDAVVARVKSAVSRAQGTPAPSLRWLTARWTASRAVMALGLACALLAAGFWLQGRFRDPAVAANRPAVVLAKVTGQVTVHGASGTVLGKTAMALHAGDSLSTVGSGARALVTFGEGPRLELGGDSSLTVRAGKAGEASAVLFQGHVTGGAAGLRLETPHATVVGQGRLALDVSPRQTFVEVQQGRGRVLAIGSKEEITLGTGQTTTVQPAAAQGMVGAPTALLLVAFRQSAGNALGALHESDQLFKNRLESLGFTVNVMAVSSASDEELRRASVVVLSFTVEAQALPDAFAELPVPIVAVESSAFTQLRFTGPRWGHDVGNGPRVSDIDIANPDHPLAAGLEGTVKVFNHPQRLRWAAPPDTAAAVATYGGAPEEHSLVFAYERGDFTADGRAPARRVGLFLGNEEIVRALNEQGWRLFDAAVGWCASAPH
jgi:hypothetical protein